MTSPTVGKLDPLAAHGHRKVRRVAAEDGPHSQQLFDLAASPTVAWTLSAWKKVLEELDKCNDCVDDWRALRELGRHPQPGEKT